jgi:hypothetical protein
MYLKHCPLGLVFTQQVKLDDYFQFKHQRSPACSREAGHWLQLLVNPILMAYLGTRRRTVGAALD